MADHPNNPHGWFYNGLGRLVDGMLPGSQFDINTGQYSNIGEGVIGAIGDSLVPGLGTIGTKIWDRTHPSTAGGFMGGQGGYTGGLFGSTSNSGFSLGGPNYGGQMPGQGAFGTGFGSGNLFNPNSYNVDAFGLPTDPTQVGPFGNPQSAPGGVGSSAASGGHGANTAPPSPVYMFNNGARAGWGSTSGPNYT